ncbi:ribosome assembly factor SBDS [Candidatus Woesearchaeota archaeon]|nr:ribosome assembly factor SBDS [Candidatus Woesearchaeota archaeon]
MSHKQQIYDKEKIQFNLIVYKKFGNNFEIAVDPDLAINYKNKKNKTREDIEELLRAEKIFSDTKKGLEASETELIQAFGTTEIHKIVQKMLEEGDIQLTNEYREHLRQEKRKKIINLIHRQAIDPKTGIPHPQTRIENAMNEAKIKIDEFKKAEDQIQDILHKLKPIIPIKIDQKIFLIQLQVQHASKLINTLKNYGKILKETWSADGSYNCELKIPAGLQEELMDELNNKTHGTVQINTKK